MINSPTLRACRALFLIAASSVIPLLCAAQATPAGSQPPSASRFELFGGYSYFHPFNSDIYNQQYDPIPGGVVASVTGYFNGTLGLQGEYTKFFNDPDYCVSTIQGGPVLRHQIGRFVPFMHFIGGAAQIGASYNHSGSSIDCNWGWVATGGLGIDYILPAASLRNHLAIRPIQADFHYSDVNYGQQLAPNSLTGGEGTITACRLSSGLVFRLGQVTPPLPASFGCEAQPVSVFPGDPITVTGKVINLEERKNQLPNYTWTTTGGRITGNAGGATVNTAGLAAGDYTVIGRVSRRNGANPACGMQRLVPRRRLRAADGRMLGQSQHASCLADSPPSQRRPQPAEPPAQLLLRHHRRPDHRHRRHRDALRGRRQPRHDQRHLQRRRRHRPVRLQQRPPSRVRAPPPPPAAPAPPARKLCSVSFERDRKRPVRVDNEAKGCLDDIALELNRETDATLVIVGKHDPQEKPDAAAERTLNVKQYLTDEKGIDPSRIQVRTGETTGRTADNVLVPAGGELGSRRDHKLRSRPTSSATANPYSTPTRPITKAGTGVALGPALFCWTFPVLELCRAIVNWPHRRHRVPRIGAERRGRQARAIVQIRRVGIVVPGVTHGHRRVTCGLLTTTESPSTFASASTNF